MSGPFLFCLFILFPLGWLAFKVTAENRDQIGLSWIVLDARSLSRQRLVKAWVGTFLIVLFLVVMLLVLVGIATSGDDVGRRSEFGEDIPSGVLKASGPSGAPTPGM
jgi:hypothetical protein